LFVLAALATPSVPRSHRPRPWRGWATVPIRFPMTSRSRAPSTTTRKGWRRCCWWSPSPPCSTHVVAFCMAVRPWCDPPGRFSRSRPVKVRGGPSFWGL